MSVKLKENAVFFDIDGVLNTQDMWKKPYTYEKDKVRMLSVFAIKHNASLVMISSWRRGMTEDDDSTPIIRDFHAAGAGHIYMTPVLPGKRRTAEIERFLYMHPEIKHYCVLDDDTEEYEKPINGLFVADSRYGITEKMLRKVKVR